MCLFDELNAEKNARQSEPIKQFLKDKKKLVDRTRKTRVGLQDFENEDKKLLGKGGYGEVYR